MLLMEPSQDSLDSLDRRDAVVQDNVVGVPCRLYCSGGKLTHLFGNRNAQGGFGVSAPGPKEQRGQAQEGPPH
jgi:hypothetical protein